MYECSTLEVQPSCEPPTRNVHDGPAYPFSNLGPMLTLVPQKAYGKAPTLIIWLSILLPQSIPFLPNVYSESGTKISNLHTLMNMCFHLFGPMPEIEAIFLVILALARNSTLLRNCVLPSKRWSVITEMTVIIPRFHYVCSSKQTLTFLFDFT